MCLSPSLKDYIENRSISRFIFSIAGVSPYQQGSLSLDNKKGVSLSATLTGCMSGPIIKKKRLKVSDLFSFMFPKYPGCNNSAEYTRKADSYFLQVSTDIHSSKLFEPLATPKESQSVGTI